MSDISTKVQEIIDKRKERLGKIKQCENSLKKMMENMDSLDTMIRQMVNEQGEMIANSPYASLMRQNPEMASMVAGVNTQACRTAIKEASEKLADYKQRSKRDGVHISVVGLAGSGKSAVLQAFSGLGNNYIPTSSGTDCTGATSIIHNVKDIRKPKMTLTFKSHAEMVDLAQQYLDELIKDPMKRIQLRPGVLEDIRALNIDEIRGRMEPGDDAGSYMDKLTNLVEHYEEWEEYAGRTDSYTTSDEKEIVTFVAQVDEIGNEYHRYFAVKTCDIECRFPEANVGKIKLIDTIGLGDNALGIGPSMLKTVREESDAVIMVIKPIGARAHGVPNNISKGLYKPVYQACKDRNLNDWLFYLLNHVSENVKKQGVTISENTKPCELAKAFIETTGWLGHEPCIVDAMNKEKMLQFLNMVLSNLMTKLDSVDEVFRREAEDALQEAWRTYSAVVEQITRIVKESVTSNTQVNQMLQGKCDEAWKNQNAVLREMAIDWREKRSEPCPNLFDAAQNILNQMMYGVYLPRTADGQPDAKAIENKLKADQVPSVIKNYMNTIRTQVKNDFLKVSNVLDQYVDAMKDGVASTLSDDDCKGLSLSRVHPVREGQPPRKWMETFTREKLDGYPTLKNAAETISSFTFGIKGFLTFEVQEALEALDPDLSPMVNVQVLNLQNMLDHSRTAINIYDELDRRLVGASKRLKTAITEMCVTPNRAICAEIEDFVDRMLYAKDAEKEWKTFYMGEACDFWAKEIQQYQKNSQVSGQWNEMVRTLRHSLDESQFILEI